MSASSVRQTPRASKAKNQPKNLENDRGAYVLDVIRAAGKDIEATLKRIVGNIQAAKALRWALGWAGKSTYCPGDSFYKTRAQWEDEAGLSESNLRTGVKHLRRFPWWKDEPGLQPNGRRAQHYIVDVEAVLAEVQKVLEESRPRRLRLVPTPSKEAKAPPVVQSEPEFNPVESTGLNSPPATGLKWSNQPDQSGETNRVNPVDSTGFHIKEAFSTAKENIKGNSHSERAHEASEAAQPAPAQADEREGPPLIFFEEEKREPVGDASPATDGVEGESTAALEPVVYQAELVSDFDRLLAAQKEHRILHEDKRDLAIARELLAAGYQVDLLIGCFVAVVNCDIQRSKSWASVRARIGEFQREGRFTCKCCRLSDRALTDHLLAFRRAGRIVGHAAPVPGKYDHLGQRDGEPIPVETEERRLEREREEAELAKAQQARREREEAAAAARAEEQARQQRVADERAAARTSLMAEIAAGRVEGVDLGAEAGAVDRLARGECPEDQLRARFEWSAANRGPGDPLGWSVVDAQWIAYLFRSAVRTVPPTRPSDHRSRAADRPSAPRSAFSDPVGSTMVAVCGVDVQGCSDSAYGDLKEAYSGYSLVSRGLPVADRVVELCGFGEWFRSKVGRAPAPIEIINRLPEFRGQLRASAP